MKLSELLDSWAESDGGPVAVALHREWADPEVVAHFTVVGEPQSKARARASFKNGKATAYTPRQTRAAEQEIAWRFRAAGGRGPDGDSTFGVFAAFFCGTRQRRDVDNMLKLILDGLNKIAWRDDSQVTEVSGRLVRGLPKDDARSEVIIYKTVTSLTGGLTATKPCEICGTAIRIYGSTAKIRFCSPQCAGKAKRVHQEAVCPGCGESFLTRGARRVYCSRECDKAARTVTTRCNQCDVEIITPRSWTRKFCSPQCTGEWRRGRKREDRAPIIHAPDKDLTERLTLVITAIEGELQ
jgi:Holliday junction resolvase RusA-like endonuclease/endogenous inhibitor of DNA gyrase (YacG/DUF329 family)